MGQADFSGIIRLKGRAASIGNRRGGIGNRRAGGDSRVNDRTTIDICCLQRIGSPDGDLIFTRRYSPRRVLRLEHGCLHRDNVGRIEHDVSQQVSQRDAVERYVARVADDDRVGNHLARDGVRAQR